METFWIWATIIESTAHNDYLLCEPSRAQLD